MLIPWRTGSVTVTTVPTGWLGAARMMPPCSATIFVRDRQAEAGAARLGGEERLEHLRGRRRVDAGALIGDLDAQELLELDRESRRMWKSVSMRVLMVIVSRPAPPGRSPVIASQRVAQHVEEHLAELRLIGQDVGQAGIEARTAAACRRASQLGTDHRHDLLDDAMDVERRQARLGRRAEREQILDQRATAGPPRG